MMSPSTRHAQVALLALVTACSGHERVRLGKGGAQRIAPMVTVTSAGSAPKAPAGVASALDAYLRKRLAVVPKTQAVETNDVDAARANVSACSDAADAACVQAIAAKTGASWILGVSVQRTGEAQCIVNTRFQVADEDEVGSATSESPCRLHDLEAAIEATLRNLPQLRALRSAPPPPPGLCEDTCTAGEQACRDSYSLTCEDGDWDGCREWAATPCGTHQGCRRGACIDAPDGMVLVGEGPYLMGAGKEQLDLAMQRCQDRHYKCLESWWRTEQPAHWVQVSGFFIDTTEVTNTAYDTCVQAKGCKAPDLASCRRWDAASKRWVSATTLPKEQRGPNKPAVCVTYDEAQTFCHWAKKRLPTEAEWEKAARGTDSRIYPWGNAAFDGSRGNGCDAQCGKIAGKGWRVESNLDDGVSTLADVGSYPAGKSPFGAFDMAGNVWEWVADWYDEGYYKLSERRDPQGPEASSEIHERILRGGSWSNEPDSMRAGYRYPMDGNQRMTTIGFRCAAP